MQTPSQPVLYKGKDAEGFDLAAGGTWIYPTNYPVRQYQYDIVHVCLFRNTLVSLPTGKKFTLKACGILCVQWNFDFSLTCYMSSRFYALCGWF